MNRYLHQVFKFLQKLQSFLHLYRFNLLIVLLFFFSFVLSIYMQGDIGISVDEPTQHNHLKISAKKYFEFLGLIEIAPESIKNAPDLASYPHKYYGVAAQYPLVLLEYEKIISNPDSSTAWSIRHLYVRILFLISGVFFYYLIKSSTKSKALLFICTLLYLLHPRISAHSFYNIKDIVFMSFCVFSVFFLNLYFRNSKFIYLIIFSFVTAITINVRIMGILIPAFYSIWLFLTSHKNIKHLIIELFKFWIPLVFSLQLIWPVLWESPIKMIYNVFEHFKVYDTWQGTVIFNGNIIRGSELPPSYIPVWICITSPYAHLLLFLIGIYYYLKSSIANFFEVKPLMHLSAYIILFSFVPILIFKSTLYGDWRHVYYLYPFLLILGVNGLVAVYNTHKYKYVFKIIIFFIMYSVISTFIWMINNYPHQYVYFNDFAGVDWEKKWDRDYWRLSMHQAIRESINKCENKDDCVYVIHKNPNFVNALKMFDTDTKSHFVLVENPDEANYFIGDYRNIIGDYSSANKPDFYNEYINITVEGKKIMTLFKRDIM